MRPLLLEANGSSDTGAVVPDGDGTLDAAFAELMPVPFLCPGFVNTNILASERNRPADWAEKSARAQGPVSQIAENGSRNNSSRA